MISILNMVSGWNFGSRQRNHCCNRKTNIGTICIYGDLLWIRCSWILIVSMLWGMYFAHFLNINLTEQQRWNQLFRGESYCQGNTERKREEASNVGLTERRKVGRRGDLIIRSVGNGRKVEFGAAEVGKPFDGEHASKWLYESNLKLPKILRDMFFALGEKVTWHPEVLNALQTIGYVHGGKCYPYSHQISQSW